MNYEKNQPQNVLTPENISNILCLFRNKEEYSKKMHALKLLRDLSAKSLGINDGGEPNEEDPRFIVFQLANELYGALDNNFAPSSYPLNHLMREGLL